MMKSIYLLNINFYNNKNKLLFSVKNDYNDKILFIKDIKIDFLLNQVEYLYCSILKNNLINKNNIFIYDKFNNNYNILFKNNIKSDNIKETIIKELKIENYENNYNKILLNVIDDINEKTKSIDLNILTIFDIIEDLKNLFNNNFNNELINNLYNVYVIKFFPLLKLKDFYDYITDNINNKYNNCKYEKEIIEQIKLIEFYEDNEELINNKNKYISNIIPKELYIETNINYFINNPKINLSLNINYQIENDLFLSLYNELLIKKYKNYYLNFIKLKLNDNELFKYDNFINEELYINIINNNKLYKYLILNGVTDYYNSEFFIIISYKKIYIKFIFNNLIDYKYIKKYDINEFIEFINNMLLNNSISSKIDKKNFIYYYNFKIDTLISLDLKKITNILIYLNLYFSIISDSKNIILSFNLDDNNNNFILFYLNNYLNKNNINNINDLNENQKQELSIILNISRDELDNNILEFINFNTSSKRLINFNKNNININKINNLFLIERLYYIINKIILLYSNNKLTINKFIKNYNTSSFYLSNIYFYNKTETESYWSRKCQNSGNKIRKPILYDITKENINDYIYEKKTDTYINKKTKERLIKTQNNIFIGCDQSKNNITKHIGFLNSCSLCCFNYDQFLNLQKLRIRNKIKQCLNLNLNNDDDDIKNPRIYKYKHANFAGDFLIIDDLFINNFNSDNYLLLLINKGELKFEQNINKLLFIEDIIINPYCFDEKNDYELYYYKYPNLYQFIYLEDINKLKNYKTKFTPIKSDDELNILNFIIHTKNKYNIINFTNFYNIYFNFKSLIKSFTIYENTNILIFSFINNLTILIKDELNYLNLNKRMFNDLLYNDNDILLEEYDDIEKEIINFCKLNSNSLKITSLLYINDLIYGICFNNNLYIIFPGIKKISNYFKNYKKITNIDILYYINQEFKDININLYIMDNEYLFDYYLFYIFKYNFFIMLYNNNNIKEELLNKIKNKEKNIKLFNEIYDYLNEDKDFKKIFKNYFKINNTNKTSYEIILNNDLSKTLSKNDNYFELDEETKDLYFKRIISELMYDFSSLYNYISRFIDSRFSDNTNIQNFILPKINIDNDINKKIGRIVDNIYYQEIFNADNNSFYRALSNIYYWNKMILLKFISYDNLNLGYKSEIQEPIINYLKDLLNNNFELDKNDININIINNNNIINDNNVINYQLLVLKLNKLFNFKVNLIINNINLQLIKDDEISNMVYINTDGLIITSLSVANIIK